MDSVGNMVVTSCSVITPQSSPNNIVDERDEVGHMEAMTIKSGYMKIIHLVKNH